MRSVVIGMLFASPVVVYWVGWQDRMDVSGSVSAPAPASQATGSVVTIPVEVIAAGSAPQWIQVQVEQ